MLARLRRGQKSVARICGVKVHAIALGSAHAAMRSLAPVLAWDSRPIGLRALVQKSAAPAGPTFPKLEEGANDALLEARGVAACSGLGDTRGELIGMGALDFDKFRKN